MPGDVFYPRFDRPLPKNQLSDNPTGRENASIYSLIVPTLPIDPDKVRESNIGVVTFLSSLFLHRYLLVKMEGVECTMESVLRVYNDGETWEITVKEWIRIMHKKPKSENSDDLKAYLIELLSRLNIHVNFLPFSPIIETQRIHDIGEKVTHLPFEESIVGKINGRTYHYSISTAGHDLEGLHIFPEDFVNPEQVPFHSMVMEYISQLEKDSCGLYTLDTRVHIKLVIGCSEEIISVTLGALNSLMMDHIYEKNPLIREFSDSRKRFYIFYNKHVFPRLAKLEYED